jgi:hypothetical protein
MSVGDALLDDHGDACRILSSGLPRRAENETNDAFREIASDSSQTEQLRKLFIHGIGISDAHSPDALPLHLRMHLAGAAGSRARAADDLCRGRANRR